MNAVIDFYRKGNAILNAVAGSLQSPFLLFVRLYWGWQFAQTGWAKFGNLDQVTNYFTRLGLPLPALTAQFIAGVELFGGILLLLGLASRATALVLFIDMFVAYVVADREALFSLISDPDKFTGATPFTFLIASLIVLAFGGGIVSADYCIFRHRRKEHHAGTTSPALV